MKTLIALPVLLLGACAADRTTYPSLGTRPAEARGFDEPAAAPVAAATADPALDMRLVETGGRLDKLVAGFDTDAARAGRAAGAAGAQKVGSEGWIAAQTALASLDSARAATAALASEVDGIARDRADTDGTPYPALDALAARAEAEAAREAAAIDALNEKLPQP